MPWFSHRFETTIARHPVGRYHYTVVYLPGEQAATLPFDRNPRLRVEADVDGLTVRGAWQPAGGRWYLMLPKAALKAAGLAVGTRVTVAFRLLDEDVVDVPVELQALLDAESAVRAGWARLTPGKQRGLAYLVDSAKRPATRADRVAQVRAVLLGLAPAPWARARAATRSSATPPAQKPARKRSRSSA